MEKVLKALGVVMAVCIGVVVITPLVLQVLPGLIFITVIVYILMRMLGGPRYGGRDRYL